MIILAHRGYWTDAAEKNSIAAFQRSFSSGFGVETDIRDAKGKLCIAHDIPKGTEQMLEDFFELYKNYDPSLLLALNVKADGLQNAVADLLKAKDVNNYFFFDMSMPDALGYYKKGLSFFTRQSEYEPHPYLYESAAGIWLDEFNEHWITEDIILGHYRQAKKICIVSPELHKRDHKAEWEHYRQIINKFGISDLALCTDYPMEAKNFFNP